MEKIKSGMEKIRIRDGKNSDPGWEKIRIRDGKKNRIRDKQIPDPQHRAPSLLLAEHTAGLM